MENENLFNRMPKLRRGFVMAINRNNYTIIDIRFDQSEQEWLYVLIETRGHRLRYEYESTLCRYINTVKK